MIVTSVAICNIKTQFGAENGTYRIAQAGRYKSSAVALEAFFAVNCVTVYSGISLFDLVYEIDLG